MRTKLVLTMITLLLTVGASADRLRVPPDGSRILFLGDSNTYNGGYVQYIEAYLYTRFPERHYDFVNLGLPSETITGLSEPDHPFPRPNLMERLERALDKVKPDLVFACYGMNDGIYYPYDAERHKQFTDAMNALADAVKKHHANLIVLTPPPFDPLPVGKALLPLNSPKYSWVRPYEGYDDVMKRYSEALLRDRNLPNVIDVHTRVATFVTKVRRTNRTFALSGDGVHMNSTGQWLIASAILAYWRVPIDTDVADINTKSLHVRSGKISRQRRSGSTFTFQWTAKICAPDDPDWDSSLTSDDRFNGYRIRVAGLPPGKYEIIENDTLLDSGLTAEQVAAGRTFAARDVAEPYRRSLEVLALVKQYERLLIDPWLTAVGHKRPGMSPGMPFVAAQTRALELDARIRERSKPITITITVKPSEQ